MAISSDIFIIEMSKFMDKEAEIFEGFPLTLEDSKEAFAEAVKQCVLLISPPSTTIQQAKETMISSLGNMSEAEMITAFTSFATTLAGGMTATPALPPPSPIVLSPIAVIGLSGGSANAVLTTSTVGMADIVTNWFKTGTATVGGSVINWS